MPDDAPVVRPQGNRMRQMPSSQTLHTGQADDIVRFADGKEDS